VQQQEFEKQKTQKSQAPNQKHYSQVLNSQNFNEMLQNNSIQNIIENIKQNSQYENSKSQGPKPLFISQKKVVRYQDTAPGLKEQQSIK